MPKRLTLKTKLIGLCLLLSVVSALVGLTSFIGTSKVSRSYESVTDIALPKLKHLNNMFLYFRDLRINVRTLGLPDLKPTEAEEYIKNVHKIIALYEQETNLYLETGFIAGEEELYNKLDTEWTQFKAMGGVLLAAYNNREEETVRRIILIDCPKSAARFTDAMDKLKAFQDTKSVAFVSDAKEITDKMNIIIISIIAIGVLLGTTVGVLFSNNIVKKFMSITENLISSSQETSSVICTPKSGQVNKRPD